MNSRIFYSQVYKTSITRSNYYKFLLDIYCKSQLSGKDPPGQQRVPPAAPDTYFQAVAC
jgi:hypothetical protein